MLTESLLSAVAEAVFSYLLEEAGLIDKIHSWLGRNPQQLAFQIALERAHKTFSKRHQQWVNVFFDMHFLTHRAVPVLARCLKRDGPPYPSELMAAWADEIGLTGLHREQRLIELTPVADDFLSLLNTELRARDELQSLFDSQGLTKLIQYTAEISQTLQALRAEITQELRHPAANYPVTTKDFTNRIRRFQALIQDWTQGFVGREFLFQAIENKLQDPQFLSGYIVIEGEPGIGKTAFIAQLFRRTGYVHHFNIRQEGIQSSRVFLENICAQLIVHYQLPYSVLPPRASQDPGFLVELLEQAVEKSKPRPVVVLIDALDESEDTGLPPGANLLYLPPSLPIGSFFIVTQREIGERRALDVRRSHYIYINDRDPQNLSDVRLYIQMFISKHQVEMAIRIREWRIEQEEFVSVMTERSDGNFKYIVLVLEHILSGTLTVANIRNIHNLPLGLRNYYRHHWQRMRKQDKRRFDKYEKPVVCILATVFEPISITQLVEWIKLSEFDIGEVIRKWREFLNENRSPEGDALFRVYHASFQDFLREEIGLRKYHELIADDIFSEIEQAMSQLKT